MAEVGQEPSLTVFFSILDLFCVYCLRVVMRAGLTKSIFWVLGAGERLYYWENFFLLMLVMFYKVTAGQFACFVFNFPQRNVFEQRKVNICSVTSLFETVWFWLLLHICLSEHNKWLFFVVAWTCCCPFAFTALFHYWNMWPSLWAQKLHLVTVIWNMKCYV